jgi:hypothetical protein
VYPAFRPTAFTLGYMLSVCSRRLVEKYSVSCPLRNISEKVNVNVFAEALRRVAVSFLMVKRFFH